MPKSFKSMLKPNLFLEPKNWSREDVNQWISYTLESHNLPVPPLHRYLAASFIKYVAIEMTYSYSMVPSQTLDRQTLDTTNPRQENTRHDEP